MGNILHPPNPKVTLTGVSGYLGGRLACDLQSQGHVVKGLARQLTQPVERTCQLDIRPLDLFEPVELRKQLRDQDVVIHLAATDYAQSQSDPDYARLINYEGTRNLISACESVKTFIYFSTIHVYGSPLKGHLTEAGKCRPNNVYAETHYAAESLVLDEAQSKGYVPVILRLSNGLGAPVYSRSGAWKLISHDFVLQGIRNGHIEARAPGNTARNFFPLRSLGKLIKKMIVQPRPGILNVGSPNNMTVKDVTNLVQERLALHGKLVTVSTGADAPQEDFTFNIDELKHLGLDLNYSLQADIDDIISFALNRPAHV